MIDGPADIGQDIARAAALLRRDGLVAIPTETVYGLAANALSSAAVARVFAAKNRPYFDPLIIHLPGIEAVTPFVEAIPEALHQLMLRFMPGPLTVLLARKTVIPDLVTAGSPLVAVRIPRHPLTLQLLRQLDFPLAAPSANPFGYVSPTTAQHVADQLGDRIDYILDGGPCEVGIESTIIGLEGEKLVIYRKGGLAVEAIRETLGPSVDIQLRDHSSSRPTAPGMLTVHYAPRTPVRFGKLADLLDQFGHERIGLLTFNTYVPEVAADHQICLTEHGSTLEAAQRLYGALRTLDRLNVDYILAEALPEEELGRAINDRLRRAAANG